MAKITFGLGTSHSPMISLPVEIWQVYAETAGQSDRAVLCVPPTGEVMTYEELLERADPAIGKSLTAQKFQTQWEACQRGVDTLSQALREAAPDVAVMVTNDQNELFFDDNYPMFSVYYGDTIKLLPRKVSENASATAKASAWGYGDAEMDVPVASDLALHCIESLRDQDFDISTSRYLNEEYGGSIGPMGYAHNRVVTKNRPYGVSHGFGFIIGRIMHNAPIPIVPISQNTCYPPNQPTPRRSYLFGQALRKAIESWGSDKKVAVMASGGLSHSVVDEEQDRGILKALAERDSDYLCSLPRHRMNAGTSESQNWITCAGAMEHLTFKTEEYVPAYRTPAGTGGGWAFGVWS